MVVTREMAADRPKVKDFPHCGETGLPSRRPDARHEYGSSASLSASPTNENASTARITGTIGSRSHG